MNKQLLISLSLFLILLSITIGVIVYGRGYRINLDGTNPTISGTGLLVATSVPNGAQVIINGDLATATDNTINLKPGEYTVKIFKDGYFPWEKKIEIKKEVVSKADALLIPTAPKLESITNIGVANPILDKSKTKIAYSVASQSATKNGLYVLDMSLRPVLTLQSASNQIAEDALITFSDSQIQWSPDSKQILAKLNSSWNPIYLISTDNNLVPQEVTQSVNSVLSSWEKLVDDKNTSKIESLGKKLRPIVIENFNILEWSADDTKILYVASKSATLPFVIKPPLVGTNSTPETRDITKDSVYVYDIKEDRNYKILDTLPKSQHSGSQPLMFFPDSKHLIYVHEGKIDLLEYDGQNQTTVYAGPFVNGYVFPWPDATKIVILTNLGNPSIIPNLYTISLK